jgi:hypothetical protein
MRSPNSNSPTGFPESISNVHQGHHLGDDLVARSTQQQQETHCTFAAEFALQSLALLALGAPSELVTRVSRAASDKIRHAAAFLSTVPTLPAYVTVNSTLLQFAESAAHGCVKKTTTCLLRHAVIFLMQATSPHHVDTKLLHICADEVTHATLSWTIVRWILHKASLSGTDTYAQIVQLITTTFQTARVQADNADDMGLRCISGVSNASGLHLRQLISCRVLAPWMAASTSLASTASSEEWLPECVIESTDTALSVAVLQAANRIRIRS